MTVKLVQKGKKKQTYQTPDELIKLVRKVDPIQIDPCADIKRTFARINFTKKENGLIQEWSVPITRSGGLVYLNPPYKFMQPWIDKCVAESLRSAQIILLAAAKPGTNWFHDAWEYADAVCFWNGRITFHGCEDPAYFDSVLFYWGKQPYKFCDVFSSHGIVQKLG